LSVSSASSEQELSKKFIKHLT